MCTIAGAKVQLNYNCYNVYFYECLRINNKIKVMKREAYGFTDDRYFELRLLALHDAGITSFL